MVLNKKSDTCAVPSQKIKKINLVEMFGTAPKQNLTVS